MGGRSPTRFSGFVQIFHISGRNQFAGGRKTADHKGRDPVKSVVDGGPMKREFLQNLKIGETALPKEVIDAIMAENGRDIQAAKDAFKDYDAIKDQLETAKQSLASFEGKDFDGLNAEIAKLRGDLKRKDSEWQAKLDGVNFDNSIKDAITKAGGRNHKAISALLDMEALKASKNQAADIEKAINTLKESDAYLFGVDKPSTPPPFSAGSGTGASGGTGGISDDLAKMYRAAGIDPTKKD